MLHREQRVWAMVRALGVAVVAVALLTAACTGEAAPAETTEPPPAATPTATAAAPTEESPEPTATPAPAPATPPPTVPAPTIPPAAQPAAMPEMRLPNVADTVELVGPAVVSVLTEVAVPGGFGGQTRTATGTGVIITQDGLALTNNHVVEGAQKITVTLDDGSRWAAELVGSDRLSDLAVLRLPPRDYTFLPVGEGVKVRVGEWVIAIGNALALPGGPTVTVGVVSALGRSREAIGGTTLNDLIQTDTVMNAGNSGGPLINLQGELVGINTAVLRSSFGQGLPIEGIGFAVNMETVSQVSRQLIDLGRVQWAYMGVGLYDLSVEAASQFELPFRQGAMVASVGPETPAERAGLLEGDVIRSLNGVQTDTVADVLRLLRQDLQVGQEVNLLVYRDGKILIFTIVLGERPLR